LIVPRRLSRSMVLSLQAEAAYRRVSSLRLTIRRQPSSVTPRIAASKQCRPARFSSVRPSFHTTGRYAFQVNSGTKFLVASIAGAANTLNAHQPLATSGIGIPPVWVSATPTSELPLQVMALQQAATATFAVKGVLRTRNGRLGLAISIASWAGLLHLHRVAQDSRVVLERALVDELGPAYRDAYDGVSIPPADVALTRQQRVLPRPGQRNPYALASDLSYGEFGKWNLLDIWARPDLPLDRRAPVLLQVHGGSWTMGSKRGQAHPLMRHLAQQGWVCVAINYRLSPKSDWPAAVVDIKRAIAWVKENIAAYGGDPKFIAITGGSAGGHLSALTALTPGVSEFQPGFETADTRVQAAVSLYGPYDLVDDDSLGAPGTREFLEKKVFKTTLSEDRDRWELASPAYQVGPDAPPFMILQGANDVIARAAQARRFAGLLRGASRAPVIYAELPIAQHGFESVSSTRAAHTVSAIERFLAHTRTS
jgi:acetyl esterase/lipase